VNDASLNSAKAWMNITGWSPHYINPVNSVMATHHGLHLDRNTTCRWRENMTAGKKDKKRLCASYDGKNKTSRLKSVLPRVAEFILRRGPAAMWKELIAARAEPASAEKSPTKSSVKRQRDEVPFLSVAISLCHFIR